MLTVLHANGGVHVDRHRREKRRYLGRLLVRDLCKTLPVKAVRDGTHFEARLGCDERCRQ